MTLVFLWKQLRRTPLHLAAEAGALECVNLLLKHGTRVSALVPSLPLWKGHPERVRAEQRNTITKAEYRAEKSGDWRMNSIASIDRWARASSWIYTCSRLRAYVALLSCSVADLAHGIGTVPDRWEWRDRWHKLRAGGHLCLKHDGHKNTECVFYIPRRGVGKWGNFLL